MKKQLFVIPSLVALAAAASSASAQGLLNIAPKSGVSEGIPLTWNLGAEGGWDSNLNSSNDNEVDSPYVGGTLGLDYANVNERTSVVLGVSGGAFYYFDQVPGREDTLYNARVNFAFKHDVSERLSISNTTYFAYEFEPDYVIGESLSRRDDQYMYAYTNFDIGYAFAERLYSTTGLRVSGIDYDEAFAAETEDRVMYGISQNFRYAADENLGWNLTYRFNLNDYDNGAETQSHFALVGVDYALDENSQIVARVGAEFRLSDDYGDKTAPYFEGAYTRDISELVSFNWLHRLGYEDSELSAVTTSRYAYRTSATLRRVMTEKVSVNGGLVYSYADFDGAASRTDNIFAARVGLNYALTQALSLGANYSFNMVDSDDSFRDYNRHRVNLTLGATF